MNTTVVIDHDNHTVTVHHRNGRTYRSGEYWRLVGAIDAALGEAEEMTLMPNTTGIDIEVYDHEDRQVLMRGAYHHLDDKLIVQLAEPATQTAARPQVEHALNEAADMVLEAAGVPATGTRYAVNLMVNTALYWMFKNPDADLQEVVQECYNGEPLESVLSWIDG